MWRWTLRTSSLKALRFTGWHISRKLSVDTPYAVSVLIGALLGVGLYFALAPHLRSHITALPSLQRTGPDLNSAATRPDAVRPKTALGEVARPRAPVPAIQDVPRPAAPVATPTLRMQGAGERLAPQTKPIRRPAARSAARRTKPPVSRPVQIPKPEGVRRGPDLVPRGLPAVLPPVSAPPEGGPRYLVEVGPVPTQERAAEIVRQLAAAGFGGRMSIIHETRTSHYQVVSETVPLTVAKRRVTVLTQLGFKPELWALAGGFAQLRFGPFATQQEAERLAERVRVTGYAFAAVVQAGGTAYVITTGPHSQDVVDAIQAVLRLRFRSMLPVTVSPLN